TITLPSKLQSVMSESVVVALTESDPGTGAEAGVVQPATQKVTARTVHAPPRMFMTAGSSLLEGRLGNLALPKYHVRPDAIGNRNGDLPGVAIDNRTPRKLGGRALELQLFVVGR